MATPEIAGMTHMDDNSDVAGFSADTEILTRGQGWITFDRLTCLDEVATRSPDGRFEWQHPESVDRRPYDGDMVHLHSRNTDLLVTLDTQILYSHRCRLQKDGKRFDRYEERSLAAGELIGRQISLVATSQWRPATARKAVNFEATRAESYGGRKGKPGKNFSATSADFAAFMGMYLSEGNLSSPKIAGHYIWIWQASVGKGFAEFQDLLDLLVGQHVPWLSKKGCWHFGNKALWHYLRGCGDYAWTKIVPAEILELDTEDLERFWHYYWLGDGTMMMAPGRLPIEAVSTTSREIAGALQEILQKLGGWAMIQTVDFSKYEGLGKTRHLTYRIVRRASAAAFASTIEHIPHYGPVGCVASAGRPVYVRRNYRPVWAGGTT